MKYFAVIDTNVLVSSLFKKGTPPAKIISCITGNVITPLYCQEIIDEYREVLSRPKFKFPKENIDAVIDSILLNGISMEKAEISEEMPDPKDIVFYQVVMESKKSTDENANGESYLVTGNIKHFPQKTFIVTPSQMLEIIER
ncbi:MAG: putative toxin-antitoxin system toxin component, PIN family [Treponema sp.]|nr:putative toxin-antitoxin system toxin component, PIN family [Candidatus Treponema equifaecale]